VLVLSNPCLSSKRKFVRQAKDVSSYGSPSAPPSTSYGFPLAEPLNSHGVALAEPLNSYGVSIAEPLNSYDEDQDIIDLYSEANDNVVKKLTESDRNIKSSYGSPSAPLSTGYGVPLAGPLVSYDDAEDIFDLYSEASDNIANEATESDITIDRNLKMLMASVPGVPGEDYPILADVLSAGDTGFSCQGKIVGGKHSLNMDWENSRRETR
jgi:hypothetical protein